VFDAVYYVIIAALKNLFSKHVIQILDADGRFGWSMVWGADRIVCYDVYTKVSDDLQCLKSTISYSCLGRQDGSARSWVHTA
jgi:hypothetical protein